ncbi:MAG: tyrosine-type recombinase/integrase [Methylobacter sp.]
MKHFDQDELEILAEFEADANEAAEAEMEYLLEASSGDSHSIESNLISKLSLCKEHDFSISDFSLYRDDEWLLEKPKNQGPVKVKFDRELPGSNDLKRVLLYYLIPDFSAFGQVKSYTTTHGHGYAYRHVEDYVFKANGLSALPEDIALITAKLLNSALDTAKNSPTSRHYPTLFFFIRLWCSLSIQGLIPEEYRLDIDVKRVDSRERHKDVINHFKGTMQTWVPFSESDLEQLVNYALFWTEEAMPFLTKAKDYIKANNLDVGIVARDKPDHELEAALSLKIGEETLLSFSRSKIKKSGCLEYTYFYTWIDAYARTLDKVRNAIFVLIALISGMRARELCGLTLNDVYADDYGDYWINVTRFKTTFDPNHHGETEVIPLPKFVGDKVMEFVSLKEVYQFKKQEFLFQSNKSRKVVKKATPALLKLITSELMQATTVDHIHPHRFRKTIAEILINRDERNIDIIRLLFGHHSYKMCLRYIGRNPYLVRSISQAIEQNFTEEFNEIVTAIKHGAYSGEGAERIAQQMNNRPDDFLGKQLKLTILNYISHLLMAGEPIFIHRTALGIYCVSGEDFSIDHLPPCLAGRVVLDNLLIPDHSNCQIECKHVIVLERAKQAINDNITFYLAILDNMKEKLSREAETVIRNKIAANEIHLANLDRKKSRIHSGKTKSKLDL